MIKRNRHPKKAIEEAIQFAEEKGWRYQSTGRSAHAWGDYYVLCLRGKVVVCLYGLPLEMKTLMQNRSVERLALVLIALKRVDEK